MFNTSIKIDEAREFTEGKGDIKEGEGGGGGGGTMYQSLDLECVLRTGFTSITKYFVFLIGCRGRDPNF